MEHMTNHAGHGSAARDTDETAPPEIEARRTDGDGVARPKYHRFSRTSPTAGRAPRVSVVIPTMNEAANLPHVLSQVSEDYEVIIVDGGSTDGTMEVARRLRPSAVVMRQPGRGKGDALFAGFAASRGDMIVTLDADGSQRASEIESFVDALDAGADFVKGSRSLKGGGSADFTLLRGAGNRALGMAANLMHGTAVTDITYGFNAFWRHCLPYVVNDASGFEGETIMYIRAARAGLKISEVACYEDRRIHGESNLRTFRDGWRILALLYNERRSEKVSTASPVALAPEAVPVAGEVAA
ncbi:MAG: hypothetical protein QOG56_2244 [Solirubrobacteraceae bacterium]|jgi:glycosyltransferase involved in cell wall biosynthesis|nr:hypothetical protein [Solirubrobacteraceae bacterium]